MNVIIEIHNGRGVFMEFLRKHRFEYALNAMFSGTISAMYYIGSTPSSAGYIAGYIHLGEQEPYAWKGVHASVHEFVEYFEGKSDKIKITDTTYMPSSLGPGDQGKVRTTVTRDPADPRKIISLHSKFLPPMNYYNTAVVALPDTDKELKTLVKNKKYEIIPHSIRLGSSSESVKMQLVRELPEGTDIDEVRFFISEIF